jgi:hypothetical protein
MTKHYTHLVVLHVTKYIAGFDALVAAAIRDGQIEVRP